jgi:ParB family chromosome partitioning protein
VAHGTEPQDHEDLALDLLAFDDETATRDLLLRRIREAPSPSCLIALRGARKLLGPDSLDPDEAALRNPYEFECFCEDDGWHLLQSEFSLPLASPLARLRERGEPSRLFVLLGRCPIGAATAIGSILINRADLPVAEARDALSSDHPPTVAAASRVLGRAKDAKSGPAIAQTLASWTAQWTRLRDTLERDSRNRWFRSEDDSARQGIPACLSALAWSAGRVGSGAGELSALIDLELGTDPNTTDASILRSAVEALLLLDTTPVEALERIAIGGPPDLRPLAADALARRNLEHGVRIAPELLTDPISFDRMASTAGSSLDPLLDRSACRLHEQGVAVPLLVEHKRIDALAIVAADHSLPDSARLGAVEGLAALATETAEEHLRGIGLDESNDEELRKAAWRSLRRSKRARTRKPRHVEVTP